MEIVKLMNTGFNSWIFFVQVGVTNRDLNSICDWRYGSRTQKFIIVMC
jgi:hypothetical protein